MEWLAGLYVPVTTPFDPVTGDAAPVSLRDNLRRWLDQPIDGFLLFGSTGEGALLDEDEKIQLLEYARDVIPPVRGLLAGAGADSTRAAIRLAKRFADAGADAVLVHAPTYYGPVLSAAAVRDHFTALADASPVPVLLYYMPKYVHVDLDPGLVGELTRHPNVAGLKDSSGDLKRFADYTDACDDHVRLFVGNGTLLYSALELGAVGGILAAGLLAADDYGALIRHHREGRSQEAGRLQEKLTPVHREIVAKAGIPGVKVAMDRLGLTGGPPRPPLRPLTEKDGQRVGQVLKQVGLL
jgi:4-hydroxy-2-oxoglutarate aldolase